MLDHWEHNPIGTYYTIVDNLGHDIYLASEDNSESNLIYICMAHMGIRVQKTSCHLESYWCTSALIGDQSEVLKYIWIGVQPIADVTGEARLRPCAHASPLVKPPWYKGILYYSSGNFASTSCSFDLFLFMHKVHPTFGRFQMEISRWWEAFWDNVTLSTLFQWATLVDSTRLYWRGHHLCNGNWYNRQGSVKMVPSYLKRCVIYVIVKQA